jgi:hypothetical protein
VASLADALLKHNMLGQDTRAATVAVAPIFLSPPANRNLLTRVSGGLFQQLNNLQGYSRQVISTLRAIAAEKIKQQTVIERIDRQERENRVEMTRLQPERRVERVEEREDDSSSLISNFLRILRDVMSTISRALDAITNGVRRLLGTLRRLAPAALGLLRAIPLLMGILRRHPAVVIGGLIGSAFQYLRGRENELPEEPPIPRAAPEESSTPAPAPVPSAVPLPNQPAAPRAEPSTPAPAPVPSAVPLPNQPAAPRAEPSTPAPAPVPSAVPLPNQPAAPRAEPGAPERAPQETAPSGDFMSEVNRVSARFGVDPLDMLAVMRAESSLNPRAQNPTSRATGLIQFIPQTAAALGTTVEEIREMSAAQQMQLVERYFQMVGLPQGASRGTLYAYVYLPGRARSAISRGDGVLSRNPENFYTANPGLDANNDGVITISDLDAVMGRHRARVERMPEVNERFGARANQPQQTTRGPQISSAPTITPSVQQAASYVPQQQASAGMFILPVVVGA